MRKQQSEAVTILFLQIPILNCFYDFPLGRSLNKNEY